MKEERGCQSCTSKQFHCSSPDIGKVHLRDGQLNESSDRLVIGIAYVESAVIFQRSNASTMGTVLPGRGAPEKDTIAPSWAPLLLAAVEGKAWLARVVLEGGREGNACFLQPFEGPARLLRQLELVVTLKPRIVFSCHCALHLFPAEVQPVIEIPEGWNHDSQFNEGRTMEQVQLQARGSAYPAQTTAAQSSGDTSTKRSSGSREKRKVLATSSKSSLRFEAFSCARGAASRSPPRLQRGDMAFT